MAHGTGRQQEDLRIANEHTWFGLLTGVTLRSCRRAPLNTCPKPPLPSLAPTLYIGMLERETCTTKKMLTHGKLSGVGATTQR